MIHLEDLDLRRRAMVKIKGLEEKVAAGQHQLFFRPADFYSALGKDAVDAVVTLLREPV